MNHVLRVHGDNILECESALKLLASSVEAASIDLVEGPAYAPVYEFHAEDGETFNVQLFAGYGRWKFPLADYIASLGGRLREAPDAIVTRLETEEGTQYERPLIALEFSGALPAGNNAWQRTGRALALAYAGIPYLYFAELGGQELDAERVIKAARFPNPLVPFAYAALGLSSSSVSLPVYIPSPSSDAKITEVYADCFGTEESIQLVRSILLSHDPSESRGKIEQKVLSVLKVLSQQRKRKDVLNAEEWGELYAQEGGLAKAEWLIKRAMPWNKKVGLKGLPASFHQLLKATAESGVVAIGSKDMPICLVPAQQRSLFARKVKEIYGEKVDEAFTNWLTADSKPLLCVWVAGFKPRGDDSRPDRGLVPLARMIFGIEDLDLLTVVYGPAKESTWKALQTDMKKLAANNGLWEAIVNLSNGILIDSSTSNNLPKYGFVVDSALTEFEKKLLPAAATTPAFGEHDVDSVLHLLFSRGLHLGVYESLCNPPGGDWSGINILETGPNIELRWTSLPRVSGLSSKRPDHIIEFIESRALLSVESKDNSSRLEAGIGPRLTKYVEDLVSRPPTAVRTPGAPSWTQYKGERIQSFEQISGGAFRFTDVETLLCTQAVGEVDINFGIEFIPTSGHVIIHVAANDKAGFLTTKIQALAADLKGLVTIEVHPNQ